MKEKSTKVLLIINAFILLILLFVLVRKEPFYVSSQPDSNIHVGGNTFESVQLGDNLIAIIDSDMSSTSYGEIVVLEYDTELNSFSEVSDYDIFLGE